MKLLIMCEGQNELALINILLDNNCLNFNRDDLLGLVPYHARQIKSVPNIKIALNMYPNDDIKILRIGDSQNEKLNIPLEYKSKIISVEKYCTKPELEMLLIIAENLVSQFEKVKSNTKPKQFAKQYIKYGKKRYDNSTQFYKDYFQDNCDLLVKCIIDYKKLRNNHKKDELYLADLLKQK